MPLPNEDFEPTEAAVPWRRLTDAGVDVVFATPDGGPATCDPMALDGVVFGQIGAKKRDAEIYRAMEEAPAFRSPMAYVDIVAEDFDGLHLAGGHAPGMKPYLESEVLQRRVAEFFAANRPVSAVCHGPVVLARAKDADSGKSVVHGRRLTALTRLLERSGFWLTMWTLGRRFRTYPEYVQDELGRALGPKGVFETGPLIPSYANPFVVRDGNLLTARWPGDADALGQQMADLVAPSREDRAPPTGDDAAPSGHT